MPCASELVIEGLDTVHLCLSGHCSYRPYLDTVHTVLITLSSHLSPLPPAQTPIIFSVSVRICVFYCYVLPFVSFPPLLLFCIPSTHPLSLPTSPTPTSISVVFPCSVYLKGGKRKSQKNQRTSWLWCHQRFECACVWMDMKYWQSRTALFGKGSI